MTYWEVVILAFVEGLTEFLPVSSTGHLILTSAWMGIVENPFVKSFNIIIQFGAILSVLLLYWKRFLPELAFYKKLIVAFLPAAVIGLLVKNKIDQVLDQVWIVGATLILGGIVLIWADHKFSDEKSSKPIEDLSLKSCLALGFIQCLAFIPGVSRSGATIVGGLWLGLSRRAAAEFSFFLAVPTLSGAALIKTLGVAKTITPDQYGYLAIGTLLSFVFATAAIKFMLSVIARFGFRHFGYYRIVLGVLVLVLIN